MDRDLDVKLAIYEHFAAVGSRPMVRDLMERLGASRNQVLESFAHLRRQRVLVLEKDGESIRMAPPFSGVPTQHRVTAETGISYDANCAWDALGIVAALHQSATVHSRCEQSLEPLRLEVSADGPEPSDWVFHCLVPAAQWWNDIVFT